MTENPSERFLSFRTALKQPVKWFLLRVNLKTQSELFTTLLVSMSCIITFNCTNSCKSSCLILSSNCMMASVSDCGALTNFWCLNRPQNLVTTFDVNRITLEPPQIPSPGRHNSLKKGLVCLVTHTFPTTRWTKVRENYLLQPWIFSNRKVMVKSIFMFCSYTS